MLQMSENKNYVEPMEVVVVSLFVRFVSILNLGSWLLARRPLCVIVRRE